MRPDAQIKPHLTVEKMFQWLQKAADEQSYKRRMAIWLTHTGRLSAPKVAEIIGSSPQAVWLWIRQYNAAGPAGLKRKGRGGRRWAFLTVHQEAELLEPLISRLKAGSVPKADEVKRVIEQRLGREVSLPYIYHLLRRHSWAEIIAQSKQPPKSSDAGDNFEKLSRPWTRQG